MAKDSAGVVALVLVACIGLADAVVRASSGLCSCHICEGRFVSPAPAEDACPDVPRSRLSVSGFRLEPRCNGRRLRDATDGGALRGCVT